MGVGWGTGNQGAFGLWIRVIIRELYGGEVVNYGVTVAARAWKGGQSWGVVRGRGRGRGARKGRSIARGERRQESEMASWAL